MGTTCTPPTPPPDPERVEAELEAASDLHAAAMRLKTRLAAGLSLEEATLERDENAADELAKELWFGMDY